MIKKAKFYIKLISGYALVMNIMLCSFIYFARENIAYFFTDQQVLIDLISSTIGYMGLVILIHGGSMVLAGALKGIGKQSIASWVILIGFYVVALPMTLVFAFYFDMGITGLWMGPVCGVVVELIVFIIAMNKFIDWDAILIDIRKRL